MAAVRTAQKLTGRVKKPSKGAQPESVLHVLRIDVPHAEADRLTAVLFEAGVGGIEERSDEGGTHWLVYCETRAEAERLARVVGRAVAVGLRVERHRLAGWRTQWMEGLTRRKLAPGLIIDPSAGQSAHRAATANETETKPKTPGDRVLRLKPALAFGYGEHPTTRLAAAAVVRHCRKNVGCCVLDVGTGSGILALSARWCGAKRVVGLDDDSGAIAAARANARLNDLTGCRFSTQRIERLRGQFDLVVANIDAGFLSAQAPQMARRTTPRGMVVVTGFLEEDAESLAATYRALGFECSRRTVEEGWALLELRRPRR